MTDQAIIALIGLAFGAIATLTYYLFSSIKVTIEKNNDEILKKIEKFVDELSEVKELIAVKSTMLDYMQREIETIKSNCWKCNINHKRNKNETSND